jgi:AbrB family looped-hinge helix DNA binding protein
MTISAKVTSKGQVTLPAELRRALGLKPGDRIDFRKTDKGNYELITKTVRFEDLRGIIKVDGPPRTIDQILDDVEHARTLRAEEIAGRIKTGQGK